MLVISRFITVDNLGVGCVLSCMPLYATACDSTDSWAPVKLNFWFDVRSKSSCNKLCVPCLASRLAFSSPAGSTIFVKVVIALWDREWDTINSLLGTLIHPPSSQLVSFGVKQLIIYFELVVIWSGANGGVFLIASCFGMFFYQWIFCIAVCEDMKVLRQAVIRSYWWVK